MNHLLAESTTSIAFNLALSKRQCNTLLRLLADPERKCDDKAGIRIVQVDSLTSLRNRGLVFWHQDATGRPCGFGGMTKAGELVATLLVEAGLSIENTNTAMTLRRMERAA